MTQRIPLLLLPGLLCNHLLWRHQIINLADIADIQVADLTQDNSIEAMALRTLASAPKRFAVAGLSMGGYVALEIMRQAPDRVAGLALLDTSARPDTPEQRRRRRELIDLAGRGPVQGGYSAPVATVDPSRSDAGQGVDHDSDGHGGGGWARGIRAPADRDHGAP